MKQLKDGNTKPLYDLIEKSRGQSHQINNLGDTTDDQIANKLAEHFVSVYRKNMSVFPNFDISTVETMNLFKLNRREWNH